MDLKTIHDAFTQKKDHTIEGQMRWLQKQSFTEDQIAQALMTVYFDLERGVMPNKWQMGEGGETVYLPGDQPKASETWIGGPISGFHELDQYLLKVAKDIRTRELTDKVKAVGEQVAKMKAQWEKDFIKAHAKPGFLKRTFGKKVTE